MSSTSRTPSPDHPFRGAGTSAPAEAWSSGGPVGNGPAPGRAGSGALARLFTVLYALIVTPVATGLIVYGGMPWQQYRLMRATGLEELLQFLLSPSGLPSLLALAGGLLLVSVVATGLASSAGLLSVSLLGLLPLSLSIVPQLLISLFEVLPEVLRPASYGIFAQGVALVLYPVLGGMGLALVIARRRPRPHLAVSLPGVVALPVVLLLGAWLTMYGYAMVMRTFSITFGAEAAPVPALLALGAGMVLLWLGVGAAGGSPYALVLPALVLLVFSAGFLLPDFSSMLPAFLFSQTGGVLMSVVATGTGAAIGLAMLVHTAVQRTVSSRARSRLAHPSAP